MKHGVFGVVVAISCLMICLMGQPSRAAKPAAAPAAKPAQVAPTFEVVVKYGGATGQETTATGIHMVFQGEALPSGDIATFLVRNANEKVKTYNPDPTLATPLAQFKAGDLIDIIFTVPKNGTGLIPIKSLKAYKLKVGEDDPNGYVFVEAFSHKTGDKTVNLITLSKYTQKTTYNVPMHLDSGGDLVVDEMIDGISGKLKAGQVVYSTHIGSGDDATIKLLAPWANHFTGKFVKLEASSTIDTDNDTGPAVELINPKGTTVTLLIPGTLLAKKWVADPAILSAVRQIKADASVDYIMANSGDKRLWVMSIQPAKPAPTTMASGMP